jgi:hypothetical protein
LRTKKSPAGLASRPALRKSRVAEQQHRSALDSEDISPGKERNANFSTAAELCLAPVDNDFVFFRKNPTAKIRNRLAFPGEFSAVDLAEGGDRDCYVRAIVKRGPDGQIRRARWLLFVAGGNA